jgi:hypothetical protein
MRFIIPVLLLLACRLPLHAQNLEDIKLNIGTAQAVLNDLEKNGNYIDDLTPGDLTQLPVGQHRTISNVEYTVGITQVKFHPGYAEFTAFMRIKIPQQTPGKVKDLFFGASGVKLSHSGGIIGDVKLGLLGDFPIDLGGGNATVILKGAFDKDNNMINGGTPVTYASIDCSGFKMLSVAAEVLFSRNLVMPDSLGVPGAGQVRASFNTTATDWNDILADITLPAFQVNGLQDFVFHVNHAVFDFSDLRNDPQTVFPAKYATQYLLPGSPALWRGVSISKVDVTLPKLFSVGDSTKRVSVSGDNVLIDHMGFSGLITAANLLTLDQGRAGSWPMSIDRFKLDMVANKVEGAGFGGTMKLPVDDTTVLLYDAMISPGNEYLLNVKNRDTMNFSFLRATRVFLYPNSSVEMKVKDGKFLPRAVLNGKMTINASMKEGAAPDDAGLARLPGLEFRALELQTVSPKIKIGSMGYSGEISFGNFPASINNIEVTASNDEARLSFGIDVQLMGEDDGGLRGNAHLAIVGKLAESKGLESWRFKGIKLDSLGVHFDKGGVEVDGHVYIFENDPTYGKGFAGDVSMHLKKMNLLVQAKAVFGKMPDYRYWYADVFANLGNKGIPIFAGLVINGIGGGAYEHMKLNGKVAKGTSGIGVSPSGSMYVPDSKTSFGLKAMLNFATQDGKAANGNLSMEMAFASGGGLRYIHFDGVAKFIKDLPADQFAQLEKGLDKLNFNSEQSKAQFEADRKAMSNDAAITAVANLDLDFENSSLHGVFDVYMNAGPMRGRGPGNLAGQVVMHYDKSDWYIHAGRPDSRIGIKFGLGPVNLDVGSYLMVGTNIPGSPAPPKIVADILGVKLDQLDYMRDLNALGTGSGFAFGTDMSLSTGDLTFLIFYAKFSAGLGFDVMLKDYGDAQCKGSDGPIGINGWYANGQAYAYLQGDIGIKVKVFRKTKNIKILSIGAAVLLQAKLPNPAWFRGYVGGNYSVLGGLVKGRCNFKVTLGEECELVNGNPLGGIQVISDITPGEGATDVDVFAAPQAVFNMSLEKEMEMDDDGGNITKYRIRLDKFELVSAGNALAGSLKWNDTKNAVALYSEEVLPPHTTVKASVVVSFEELKGGTWRPVMYDGQKSVETKEINFVTGEAPESIPLSNIQYTYPVLDQQHFYVKEYATGYIQLKRGQSYLFDKTNGWQQLLRLKDAAGAGLKPEWSYDATNKRVNWTMPALNPEAKYTLDIVNLPPAGTGTGGQVNEGYTATDNGDGSDTQIRNNQAAGALTNSNAAEKLILTYAFGTSRYGTFAEKIRAAKVTLVMREPIYLPDVHALQVFTQTMETFDQQELTGSSYTEDLPLIRPLALLDGDIYYNQYIQPLIYSRYPYGGLANLSRTKDQSLEPVWSIYPIESYLLYPDANKLPFRYHLPKQYKTDLVEIQTQLATKIIRSALPAEYHGMLNVLFPVMKQGTYKMRLSYVLPGGIPGSSTVVEMYNPIL